MASPQWRHWSRRGKIGFSTRVNCVVKNKLSFFEGDGFLLGFNPYISPGENQAIAGRDGDIFVVENVTSIVVTFLNNIRCEHVLVMRMMKVIRWKWMKVYWWKWKFPGESVWKLPDESGWKSSGESGWKLYLMRIRWNAVMREPPWLGQGWKRGKRECATISGFAKNIFSPKKNRIGVQMEIFSVSRKPWLVSRLWGTRGAKPPNLSTIPAKTGDHHIESGNDDQNDEKVLQCRGSFLKYGTKLKVFCGSQD